MKAHPPAAPGLVAPRALLLCLLVCAADTGRGQDMQAQIARIDQRICDNQVRIQQLVREKERVLNEMRNGLFCSERKRSKSEIERAGTSFEKHLRDVNGRPVASPATLAEKAAFCDRQIAALQPGGATGARALEPPGTRIDRGATTR